MTPYGKIDVALNPAGADGYADLTADASRVRLPGGVETWVVSLERVIQSKRAAGRAKDWAVLPELERLLRAREEEAGR